MANYLSSAAKGCVVRASSEDRGYYRISGLKSSGPVFVQSVLTNLRDIASALACFNNKHRFYVFGRGFGDVVVNIEAFLGNDASDDVEGSVRDFFDSNRVSSSKSPVIVTSRGGSSYSFYLTGMRVTGTNPDTNMIALQLVGNVVE
jgi:hypothetical protein